MKEKEIDIENQAKIKKKTEDFWIWHAKKKKKRKHNLESNAEKYERKLGREEEENDVGIKIIQLRKYRN